MEAAECPPEERNWRTPASLAAFLFSTESSLCSCVLILLLSVSRNPYYRVSLLSIRYFQQKYMVIARAHINTIVDYILNVLTLSLWTSFLTNSLFKSVISIDNWAWLCHNRIHPFLSWYDWKVANRRDLLYSTYTTTPSVVVFRKHSSSPSTQPPPKWKRDWLELEHDGFWRNIPSWLTQHFLVHTHLSKEHFILKCALVWVAFEARRCVGTR